MQQTKYNQEFYQSIKSHQVGEIFLVEQKHEWRISISHFAKKKKKRTINLWLSITDSDNSKKKSIQSHEYKR